LKIPVPGFGTSQVILPGKQQLSLKKKERMEFSNWGVAREEILVFLPVKAFMYIRLIIQKAG
jgi:hypothetical protein